jgi:hypothetical protein
MALHTPIIKSGRLAQPDISPSNPLRVTYPFRGSRSHRGDRITADGNFANKMADTHREPFLSWIEERASNPACFDMQRVGAVPARASKSGGRMRGPEAAWNARRRHAPRPKRINPAWGMDSVFFRVPGEAAYVEAPLEPGSGEERKSLEQEGGRKRARTEGLGEWGPGLPPRSE